MSKLLHGKRKILLVAMLAVALCVAAGCARAGAGSDDKKESKTTTAQAIRMTVENTLTAEGEVVSSLEENLQPHTGYYLKKIKVEAGQAVKEGETILTYKNGKKMKAPYDLVVESWSLPDKGDQITSDHSITVAGTDALAMEISVAEDQVAKVRAGDKAIVTVSAVDKTYEGEVTSVSEVGTYSDSGSTFTAKVTFDNDGSVKVGMSGSASITLETAEDVVAVPVNAVSQKRGKKVVTVQKDGDQTEVVEVETGVENDAFVEIKSGLSEGDTVIVPESADSDSSGFPGGGFPGGFPGSGGSGSGGSGNGGPPAGFDGSGGPPSGFPGGSGSSGGSGSGGPPSAPSGN